VTTVLFTAFEPSGDRHAAPVVAELRRRHPEWRLLAAAGPFTEQAGAVLVAETASAGVMGLEAARRLQELPALVGQLQQLLPDQGPVVHIPVDSPAAQFRITPAFRARGAKTVHWVAPKIWARRWDGRLAKLRRQTDALACLFPFEADWFVRRGIPATFVGHPSFSRAIEASPTAGLPETTHRVAILPGSRSQEIRDNLPLMLEVMDRLRSEMDVSGVIVAADSRAAQQIEALNQNRYPVRSGDIDGVLAWSSFAFAVSGTVTLDVARHRRPGIGIYACGLAFRMIAKMLIRGMVLPPNLVLGREAMPELAPIAMDPELVLGAVRALLNNDQALRQQVKAWDELHEMYEGHDPGAGVADLVDGVLA
jgi:lipid-A-disaccharide synthase